MSPIKTTIRELVSRLEIGDVAFIRAPVLLFQKIAGTTESWTYHVGIVIDLSGSEPVIAESRFPLSGVT